MPKTMLKADTPTTKRWKKRGIGYRWAKNELGQNVRPSAPYARSEPNLPGETNRQFEQRKANAAQS